MREIDYKLITLLITLLLVFSTVIVAEEVPVKIGVIASLAGKGAARGESARQGIQLAYEHLVSRGLIKRDEIQLVYQDVPLDKPARVTTALHQLIQVEKVSAILGPMGSSPSHAASPIIEKAEIPTITHTSSSPTALVGTSFLFRLWPTGLSYARVIADTIQSRGYKRIGALTATHDSPVDLRDSLKRELSKRHGANFEFILDEEFTTEDTDFRLTLTKLSKLHPDAIFLNLFEGQIGVAAKQGRELGIQAPFFTNAVMSDAELKTASIELEDVWFPRFAGYTEVGRDSFLERFGHEPPNPESAAAAHDALLVIVEALSSVGHDPKLICDYIRKKDRFHGITGDFRFLENGDATVEIKIHHVHNGTIIAER